MVLFLVIFRFISFFFLFSCGVYAYKSSVNRCEFFCQSKIKIYEYAKRNRDKNTVDRIMPNISMCVINEEMKELDL